jgi:tetratricopeptide (TPR) repeat protein
MAAVLVVLALALGACAARTRVFRCPAHGGPAWRELASDHFVVRTDLPAREAASLVGRFERMRAAVAAALPGATPAPGRVEVIAFRTREEYAPFAPDGAEGYYLRSEGGPPRIVLSADLGEDQRVLLAHELTHHFLAGALLRQPRWFAEGLAVYMESLGDTGGRGLLEIGAPSPARLGWARRWPVPVKDVLAWDGTAEGRPALDYYAASWLLVHWLSHRRPDAFEDLQRRLAVGERPDGAWAAALPDLDPRREGALAALDAELARYAAGELERHRREVEIPVAVGYFERAVPAAEVHAVRLALWGHGPKKGVPALRAEVEEALEEDPAHPIALQYRAELDGADPVRLARASIAAHPDDPRAWTFLAHALQGKEARGEREAAYRRAVELAPGNAAALHNLAQDLLAQGRSGEALPVARKATQLAPWSPPLLDGYAAALADVGRCAEAIPVQERAIDVLPDRATDAARRAFGERLARYAQQCRVAAEAREGATAKPTRGAP